MDLCSHPQGPFSHSTCFQSVQTSASSSDGKRTSSTLARVVDGMLGLAEQPGNSFPLYSAEVQLVWPPCALQGQGSSVEVRTEVARICAPKRLAEPKKVFTAKLLTVRNDSVLGEELLKVDGGEALTRVRVTEHIPGILNFVVTDGEGVPSLEAFHSAAPLIVLPAAARNEVHKLLWSMMHEALPSGAQVPYDPAAFEGSFELLPVPLQAALAWSWGRHFRAFVNDLSYLIECVPGGNDAGAVPMSSLLQADPELLREEYNTVMTQMITFLRANDMYACLAFVLRGAWEHGLCLLQHGQEAGPDALDALDMGDSAGDTPSVYSPYCTSPSTPRPWLVASLADGIPAAATAEGDATADGCYSPGIFAAVSASPAIDDLLNAEALFNNLSHLSKAGLGSSPHAADSVVAADAEAAIPSVHGEDVNSTIPLPASTAAAADPPPAAAAADSSLEKEAGSRASKPIAMLLCCLMLLLVAAAAAHAMQVVSDPQFSLHPTCCVWCC